MRAVSWLSRRRSEKLVAYLSSVFFSISRDLQDLDISASLQTQFRRRFDTDGDGFITKEEFEKALTQDEVSSSNKFEDQVQSNPYLQPRRTLLDK